VVNKIDSTSQLRVEDQDDDEYENDASGDLRAARSTNSEVVLDPIFWSKSELLSIP
jgi:hypothetical protein